MIVSVVARRYAKALVALAHEQGRLPETGAQLTRVTQLINEHAVVLMPSRGPQTQRWESVHGRVGTRGQQNCTVVGRM